MCSLRETDRKRWNISKEHPAIITTSSSHGRLVPVHRLRIEPETRSIPVIFFRYLRGPEDKAFALTIGATRFMKNRHPRRILPLIEELLNKSTPWSSNRSKKRMHELPQTTEIKLAEKNARIAAPKASCPPERNGKGNRLIPPAPHQRMARNPAPAGTGQHPWAAPASNQNLTCPTRVPA